MIFELEPQDLEKIAAAVAERIQPAATPWLDANEAADYLHCSARYVNKLAERGDLPTYKPAGKRLFRREDLDALALENPAS